MNIPWIERGSQPDGGASGSEVRLVHAWPGHGLLFFNWGNFRRLQNPAADEYTLEFRNVGACGPGVCTQFVLDWTDAFILCPMKYLWPVCVRCTKFLFPHEAHRESKGHRRRQGSDDGPQGLVLPTPRREERVWKAVRGAVRGIRLSASSLILSTGICSGVNASQQQQQQQQQQHQQQHQQQQQQQ